VGGRVGEAVDQAEHRRGDAYHAGYVQPGRAALLLPREQDQRAGQRHDGEEQVHVQAPAPVQVLGQRTAKQQPDQPARADDRAEHGERLAPLLGVAERSGQDRQGRRGQQRAEHPLTGPRRDQHREADRGPAHRRRDREADQPGDERQLAAEQVAQPSAEQQQAAGSR
jgi:hypothetical protein